MKYIKLTHRLFVPPDTIAIEFVDYDTNDEMFNQCATVRLNANERKHEEQIDKIQSKLIAIQAKCCRIQIERDELVCRTPFFLRIASKEYKSALNRLNEQLSTQRQKHEMQCEELHKVRDDLEAQTYEDYSTLKHLLKDMGYTLSGESQKGDSSITIEVWHKQ